MPLATLAQIALPADAIRCEDWDHEGRRCYLVKKTELHGLRIGIDGDQDYTGATEGGGFIDGTAADLTVADFDEIIAALVMCRDIVAR